MNQEDIDYLQSGEYRNYTPFLVYAIDSPEYWGKLFTSYCMRNGWRRQRGSAIIITGGYLKPDESSMFVTGIIGESDKLGTPFLERAVAALVDPRDRVFIRSGFAQDYGRLCANANRSGFDVTLACSSDGYPVDAISIGTGAMLSGFSWLEQAEDGGTFLIASSRPPGELETCLNAATDAHMDTQKIIGDIWSSTNPNRFHDMLGDFDLLAGVDGPDYASVCIERCDEVVGHIHGILHDIASDLGVALFHAGSISTPDESGESFDGFPWFLKWHPMPEHWMRIA